MTRQRRQVKGHWSRESHSRKNSVNHTKPQRFLLTAGGPVSPSPNAAKPAVRVRQFAEASFLITRADRQRTSAIRDGRGQVAVSADFQRPARPVRRLDAISRRNSATEVGMDFNGRPAPTDSHCDHRRRRSKFSHGDCLERENEAATSLCQFGNTLRQL